MLPCHTCAQSCSHAFVSIQLRMRGEKLLHNTCAHSYAFVSTQLHMRGESAASSHLRTVMQSCVREHTVAYERGEAAS